MGAVSDRRGWIKKPETGGPWGTGLALAGVGFGAYGSAYLSPTPATDVPEALWFISVYVPLWVWAAVWLVAAGLSLWAAFTPPQTRRDAVPLIVVTHLWGTAYMLWFFYQGIWGDGWGRSWRGWVLFGGISTLMIVWSRLQNPPRQIENKR